MKWLNLVKNKCPKCNKPLGFEGSMIICSRKWCDFKITEDKMNKIVSEKAKNIFIAQEPKEEGFQNEN